MTWDTTAYDHGTRAAYVHGCRCDDCRRAERDYMRERRRTAALEAGGGKVTDPDTGDTVRLVLYDPAAAAWRDRAACADPATAERLGITPTELLDLFFPGRGESNDLAVAICRTCPVRTDCLEYALANHIEHGVWGGFSERARVRMRTARRKEPA